MYAPLQKDVDLAFSRISGSIKQDIANDKTFTNCVYSATGKDFCILFVNTKNPKLVIDTVIDKMNVTA